MTMGLKAPVRVGGGASGVNLRVPRADPRAIEAASLRADIDRRARQLGAVKVVFQTVFFPVFTSFTVNASQHRELQPAARSPQPAA
ncbi:MAG TPA: hypothetical protein VFO19_05865 [Vicinamibacterales bacterium]|nr:hypothetical protein [Vicinamibacterales bacterium]